MATHNISGLASSLAARGLLPLDKLQAITTAAANEKKSRVSYLVENDFIDSLTLAQFCEAEYGLPLLDSATLDLDNIPENFMNPKLIEKHHVLPVYVQQKILYLAMSDPTNVSALEDFGLRFSIHTEALLVEEKHLNRAIETLLEDDSGNLDEMVDMADINHLNYMKIGVVNSHLDERQHYSRDDMAIVKYINSLLLDAVRKGASDLHFEPSEKVYQIRFCVGGILHEVASPSVNLIKRFSACLKVMSKLDISERCLPQDGRIKLKIANKCNVDLRVSTMPTLWGEKVVMRILSFSLL